MTSFECLSEHSFSPESDSLQDTSRVDFLLQGCLQGVGWRPFLQRLSDALQLGGYVRNTQEGCRLQWVGLNQNIQLGIKSLKQRSFGFPPAARLQSLSCLEWQSYEQSKNPASADWQTSSFSIIDSNAEGMFDTEIPRDRTVCQSCWQEFFDVNNRRYRYPFICCADCGPRYSILAGMPFDRKSTAMEAFPLCESCQAEYQDASDRRFFAQTMSCSKCGPKLEHVIYRDGVEWYRGLDWSQVHRQLLEGNLVLLKGIGGYQLLANPWSVSAVALLRDIKARPAKPLALMVKDTASLRQLFLSDAALEAVFQDSANPIVVAPVRTDFSGADQLLAQCAPGLDCLGAMLPSSGLHQLCFPDELPYLIVTSANTKDQAILTDDDQALAQFVGVVGAVVLHNREILHALDDSVVYSRGGERVLIRPGRGFAPLRIDMKKSGRGSTVSQIAYGAESKHTFALYREGRIYLSQYLGNLNDRSVLRRHEYERVKLQSLTGIEPEHYRCDAHPDYLSTRLADHSEPLSGSVCQHHLAHARAIKRELGWRDPVLAVVFDGFGWGQDDRQLWGGEAFGPTLVLEHHLASLRPLPVFGRSDLRYEPRRAALALLWEWEGWQCSQRQLIQDCFDQSELAVSLQILAQSRYTAQTTSVGRFLDACAVLLGLHPVISYEAEAVMGLEALAWSYAANGAEMENPATLLPDSARILLRFQGRAAASQATYMWDWSPLVAWLVSKPAQAMPARAAFIVHIALADMILELVKRSRIRSVCFSGGVFQNLLLVTLIKRLGHQRFPLVRFGFHEILPPNDANLALGQIGDD